MKKAINQITCGDWAPQLVRWPEYLAAKASDPFQPRIVMGAMSGTSCDGVTVALVETEGYSTSRKAKVLSCYTCPYPEGMKERLFGMFPPNRFDAAALLYMIQTVAGAFAKAVNDLLKQEQVNPVDVHLLSVHGPTLYHKPIGPYSQGGFYELMEPAIVAELTCIPVVSDLRSADNAAGGHGAPLSVFADYVLLRQSDRGRIIQNIGGIANPTVIFAGANWEDLLCFDTGPGNMVIDEVVRRITGGKEEFDRDGERAARGRVNAALLEELMQHPFIRQAPPKSGGREEFGAHFADQVMERANAIGLSADDLTATVTALTAESIVYNYRHFVFPFGRIDEVVLTGGGACNSTLRVMITERLPDIEVKQLEALGMSSEAREALFWAVLADEGCLGYPSNVPKTSGAKHPAILGKYTPGPRFVQPY